jgi:hypothetical protein
LSKPKIERAERKPTESLDAYDYFLRAMAKFYQWSRGTNDEAMQLFYKAIEIDPSLPLGEKCQAFAWHSAKASPRTGTVSL